MKYAGILFLTVSTTAIGTLLSFKTKRQRELCRRLCVFCEMLLMNIGYKKLDLPVFLKTNDMRGLEFITLDSIISRKSCYTCLNEAENRELSEFLFMLGKSDCEAQRRLISAFKDYICKSEEKYSQKYIQNSRVYISLGFFAGALVSLISL